MLEEATLPIDFLFDVSMNELPDWKKEHSFIISGMKKVLIIWPVCLVSDKKYLPFLLSQAFFLSLWLSPFQFLSSAMERRKQSPADSTPMSTAECPFSASALIKKLFCKSYLASLADHKNNILKRWDSKIHCLLTKNIYWKFTMH